MTVKAAALALGSSPRMVRNWIAQGRLKAVERDFEYDVEERSVMRFTRRKLGRPKSKPRKVVTP